MTDVSNSFSSILRHHDHLICEVSAQFSTLLTHMFYMFQMYDVTKSLVYEMGGSSAVTILSEEGVHTRETL